MTLDNKKRVDNHLTKTDNKIPSFLTMAKAVGPLCNLNCSYCYYLTKTSLFPNSHSYKMKEDVLEAYIKNAIESSDASTVQFVWHGGEPTLLGINYYKKVIEFQKKYSDDSVQCINIIQTNGVLLNESWCKFFKDEKFWVGLSMDGPAKLHNANRKDKVNGPTFKEVINAYTLLRDFGIDPDVLCTLNATTAKHPAEIYNFFRDLNVRWLQFLPIVQIRPDGTLSKESVLPSDLGYFLTKVFDMWVRNDVGKIDVQTFFETLMAYANGQSILCINAKYCGNVLVVEHDGGIYSCDHFVNEDHYLGNVVDTTLIEAFNSPFQTEFSEAKYNTLPEKCLNCKYLFACNGGCPKDRVHSLSGFQNKPIQPSNQPINLLGKQQLQTEQNKTVEIDVGELDTGNLDTGNLDTGKLNTGKLNILCEGYLTYYNHVDGYMKLMAQLAKNSKPIALIMDQVKYEDELIRRAKKTNQNRKGGNKNGKKIPSIRRVSAENRV